MRPFWLAGFVLCAAAGSANAQTGASYDQGHSDRLDWEIWFGNLQGDRRAGAEYWASQRSLAHPGGCGVPNGNLRQDFIDGCHEAQYRLNPTDIRRRTDPQYRLGWNAPLITTGTATASPADSAPASQPTPLTTNLLTAADSAPAAAPFVAPTVVTAQPPADENVSPLWVVAAALSFTFLCMALIYIRIQRPSEGRVIQQVRVQRNSNSGVLSGIIGCVFAVLGIFSIGFIFVPLAALFSLVGLLRSASGFSAFGLLVSLVGAGLTVAGFVSSPFLWVPVAALIGIGMAHR